MQKFNLILNDIYSINLIFVIVFTQSYITESYNCEVVYCQIVLLDIFDNLSGISLRVNDFTQAQISLEPITLTVVIFCFVNKDV